jgi:opacity protein-like surface antigen
MKTSLRMLVALSSFATGALVVSSASAQQQEPGWETVPGAPPPLPPASAPPPSPPPAPAPAPQPQPATPVGTTTLTNAEVAPRAAGQPAEAPQEAPGDTNVLLPRQVEVRATLNTGPLLPYVGLGVSADVGTVAIGPGTFAVGAAFEHGFCGSSCWSVDSKTPLDLTQHHNFPQARASYHLGWKNVKQLDLYPMLAIGAIFASSTVDVDHGAAQYRASDAAAAVTMGGGASYAIAGRVFVGGEARVRYGGGSYEYTLASGSPRTFDRDAVSNWSVSGLDLLFAVGARLP